MTMPNHEQLVEIQARQLADKIFYELQDGRRTRIRFADYHPDVERRLRALLAGDISPRFENPDD